MIKRLAQSLREYRKQTILTPFYVSLEVIIDVVIPLLMASLIDEGIGKGNMAAIWQYGAWLVLCCLLSLLFGALAGRTAAVASAGYAHNLRQDLYHNVQSFSFLNIDILCLIKG